MKGSIKSIINKRVNVLSLSFRKDDGADTLDHSEWEG